MKIRANGWTWIVGGLLAGVAAIVGCGADRLAAPDPMLQTESVPFVPRAGSLRAISAASLTRVDRMGMPAVATAVIKSKDAYNQADPTTDAAGAFVSEIVSSVEALHGALDDDLAAAGLTPCATADCVGQAAPFVVPDVLRIDPMKPAGFPNGRRLTDPVVDVTLALVLLDLDVHPVTALVGLNPTAGDHPFMDSFPYLARRHPSGLAGFNP